MLEIEETAIPDVKILTPKRFGDERGFFSETYNQDRLARAGISIAFVQDNHSWSAKAGVVRGLHFQSPPFAQDKLVRVVRGRVLECSEDLVDARRFGQVVLSAELDGLHRGGDAPETSEHDDLDSGEAAAQGLNQIEPAFARHSQIDYGFVRCPRFGLGERFGVVVRYG